MKKKCTENGDGTAPPAPSRPDGGVPVGGDDAGGAAPDDAVFRDIVKKAAEGNIKYQELYLKYIDLISEKTAGGDEVVYEATFIDDEDQEA
jgi:hypothetical protein